QDGAFPWLLSSVIEEPCRGREARSHFRHILTSARFTRRCSACRAWPATCFTASRSRKSLLVGRCSATCGPFRTAASCGARQIFGPICFHQSKGQKPQFRGQSRMNVESSDGRCLRRRKSSSFLRGEASLGRPFHICRCYRSVLTRKKDSCRHTCNIWAVLGLFGGSLAAIDRHPAPSLCSGLCCCRIGLVFGSR